MKHLHSNRCHDESEVWCGDPNYFECKRSEDADDLIYLSEAVEDVAQVDCHACLEALLAFATKAMFRKFDLVIKADR